MRKTVTHCYEQLAVIEMHLWSARTNATFVKCRGVQPPLFPLAEADLLAAVRARRARGDAVNALWLRSQMLRLVDEHHPKSDVPAELH